MGEAKRKHARQRTFLDQHQICCFCGGATPATTVDHVPSIQMFSLRHRPKGLEVPACEPCNQATRQHEQVAAMFGRLYPDPSTDEERRETRKVIKSVRNNNPGLLEELQPSLRQRKLFRRANLELDGVGGPLNCQGPLLNRSMQEFGAKLGYALHYSLAGRIVPPVGGVAVRWFSNFEAFTGEFPSQFLELLGPSQTLKQGAWDVGKQFRYAYGASPNANSAAYFCTFRASFAVLSWVCHDRIEFEGAGNFEVHLPGQF